MEYYTQIYIRKALTATLVHFNTGYPHNMIDSPLYSQMLWVKQIVDDYVRCSASLDQMEQIFLKRGYPRRITQKFKDKVKDSERQELLLKQAPKEKSKIILFVSTFNDSSQEIAQIVQKHWGIIKNSYVHIPEFQLPPLFSYHSSTNLKDRHDKLDYCQT